MSVVSCLLSLVNDGQPRALLMIVEILLIFHLAMTTRSTKLVKGRETGRQAEVASLPSVATRILPTSHKNCEIAADPTDVKAQLATASKSFIPLPLGHVREFSCSPEWRLPYVAATRMPRDHRRSAAG
jgi:hypothetical protein